MEHIYPPTARSPLVERRSCSKLPGVTQARVSDTKRGKFGQFSLDMLVRWDRGPDSNEA